GRLDLPALAATLRGAGVVVAGNTGPAHLAAAVGTPVVSLFAPVVPAVRWAPYGVPVALLGDQDAPCAGSRARVCPVPGHPCLADVDVVVLQRPDELPTAERLLRRRLGRDVAAVYLEHNTPKGAAPNERHPLADQDAIPIVHVTHTNDLLWDSGRARTTVVEHGIV